MNQQSPDLFASTAPYYARYRPPYPSEFFQHVVARFDLDGTGRLLDLGCGTGQLAIPLAPHFAQVVGLDRDAAMLAEAEKEARSAGVTNACWIRASDTDLEQLHDEIGPVRLATFGRAFHWMNQATTLHTLDSLIEPGGGLVIAADFERIWHVDGDWQHATQEVIRRWLGDVRRAGSSVYSVAHVPFEETLAVSAFSQVVYYSIMVERHPTIDDIVGYLYSTSFCSPYVLGDKRAGFEADLRQTLTDLGPDGHFSEQLGFDAWLATRG